EGLAPQVRIRDIAGEPELASESLKADMMRTLQYQGPYFGPAQPRLADHGDAGRAFNRLHDPHQLRRPERAAELQEARRKINHPEGTRRRLKCCFQDVRVRHVALR